MHRLSFLVRHVFLALLLIALPCVGLGQEASHAPRERISINSDWRFFKYASAAEADGLIYDIRPSDENARDDRPADEEPTEGVEVQASDAALKAWILPTGNPFLEDASEHHVRPEGSPGKDFAFVQSDFDDDDWETVNLPHDWAIKGPFMTGHKAEVRGGMGRLPSPGVGWYRKDLSIASADSGKQIYLDVDGAMSYAMVWLNGELVGGWPFGYTSWRLDLTPYVNFGGTNQLAIRIDNPPNSSRWYPGGGLYRSVWITKTAPVHISHWGTSVTTPTVSGSEATVQLAVSLQNDSQAASTAVVSAELFELDTNGERQGQAVANISFQSQVIKPGSRSRAVGQVVLQQPKLWGPPPEQTPNMYVAVTTVKSNGMVIDRNETRFGIRSLAFKGNEGLLVNGQHVYMQGVNQHHDLGALGAAFNRRAAERQLELLREMGCNAIRLAHNPPAAELLDLTDSMGFVVIDELYDVWERKKTPLDSHLIFRDWHEQDLRSLIRRDRNHPSVIMWSLGNEVGEQYTGEAGAVIATRLHEISKSEDPTRPTTASMNFAKPNMALPPTTDAISLNYQGEGIRNAPGYSHLKGINTPPLYPAFHEKFPEKLILSSENAAALSSRGEYMFPVTENSSAPVADGLGGDPNRAHVSSYELYTAPFGSSADKVLRSLEMHPYVGGGFVWSGWDYLGEPTPYYSARSSYFGVIDLAGFKKDRFFLYQAHWRPDFPMVHVLPHWSWPERVGKKTPVHVFTSGDEAELFLNGKSLGKRAKGEFEYRLRWDDVVYQPGEIRVVATKDGQPWANQTVRTAGAASQFAATADRATIAADGEDLCFVSVRIQDENGNFVPQADNEIQFSLDGPGEIVATDNGDPTCMVAFPSHTRPAFNGCVLVVVRGLAGQAGAMQLHVKSKDLTPVSITIQGR